MTSSSNSTRRMVIVGLGNYTHPQTKHSVGQLLLKNLIKKASSIKGSSGSPNLQLTRSTVGRLGTTSSWITKITIPPPPSSSSTLPLEILFVLPKALMNVCGKTIVETIKDFLPPPTPLIVEQTSSSPPDQDQHDHQQKKKEKENKKKLAPPFSLLKPIPKLLILCDDLDLSPLSCRLQRSGGPKGHNGIRSLISASASPSSCNNSKDFWRFWIGIGRPPGEGLERGKGVSQWVLGPLSREEVEAVELNQEEGGGRGGVVLERAWKEVLKIGFEEEGI